MGRFVKVICWLVLIGAGFCVYSAYTLQSTEHSSRRTHQTGVSHTKTHKLTEKQQKLRQQQLRADDSIDLVKNAACTVAGVMILSLILIPRLNGPSRSRQKFEAPVSAALPAPYVRPIMSVRELDAMLRTPLTRSQKEYYRDFTDLKLAEAVVSLSKDLVQLDMWLNRAEMPGTVDQYRLMQTEKVDRVRYLDYVRKVQSYRQRQKRLVEYSENDYAERPWLRLLEPGKDTLTYQACEEPVCNTAEYFKSADFTRIDRRWKDLRVETITMNRQQFGGVATCANCRHTEKEADFQINVDHCEPRISAPFRALDSSNLQLLCSHCNTGKSNKCA